MTVMSPDVLDVTSTGVAAGHRETANRTMAGAGRMDGWVRAGFEDVARVFQRQLRRTTGGAAVSVYHRGELVVDLWGGWRAGGRPWQRDTLAMCFSTTKGVISTALHLLADRGQIEYDAPVAAYWPQFAQGGKENITVRHVLTHSAGLHRMRTLVDHERRMLDWGYMVSALERAEPAYEPGTRHGYHGLTYGWLVGELVRRVSGRSIARFVEEELTRPLGLDGLYVGCPPEQRARVASLAPMARELGRGLGAVMSSPVGQIPSLLRLPVSPRRFVNTLLPRGIEDVLWGPEVMDAEIPAVNGFFTARALAKLYAVLAHGGQTDGVRLLSPQTLEKIAVVHSRGPDHVLVLPMGWRLGYHSAFTTRGTVPGGFGHFGLGGSGGWADPRRDLALAMVCNRGTATPIGDLRIAELSTAVARAPAVLPARYKVSGQPAAGPDQACQTARTAGASAAAWARPAAAAAARRDTSSTLRPMARMAARSGRTSATRAPAAVSAAACRRGLAMKPTPAATGATMTTRSYPCARSALATVRMPPSMKRRSPIVTGGQIPGTAQLAPTASTRLASPAESNTANWPVRASTAVTFRARDGQTLVGSRASKTFRRSASGMVGTASAHLPIRARARLGSRLV